MKLGDSSTTILKMQSGEKVSSLDWKARLCSLPTTRCDPFLSSTKPSYIIHVQIKFPAEVQFHIHKAAKLKQEKNRQYHGTLLNTSKSSAVWKKFQNHWTLQFNVWTAETFLEEFLNWLWNSNNESQTVVIQHCYSELLSLMFNWAPVGTRRRHDIGISIVVQMFDVMFQSYDENFTGVGELRANLDVVFCLMFSTLNFCSSCFHLACNAFFQLYAFKVSCEPSIFQHCFSLFFWMFLIGLLPLQKKPSCK